MTPGERAVWAAAYGAAWAHLSWEADVAGWRRMSYADIASKAAAQADNAVDELRSMAAHTRHEFHLDAREVIGS